VCCCEIVCACIRSHTNSHAIHKNASFVCVCVCVCVCMRAHTPTPTLTPYVRRPCMWVGGWVGGWVGELVHTLSHQHSHHIHKNTLLCVCVCVCVCGRSGITSEHTRGRAEAGSPSFRFLWQETGRVGLAQKQGPVR
jgi:hypothetical protein